MRGAGGTSGGIGSFFLGLVMLCGGLYLLMSQIIIRTQFGFGMRLYHVGGGYGLTSGMIMFPFMIGVGMIFYNSKNIFGWIIAGGSLFGLIIGVIASINFTFKQITLIDLIIILVMTVGGLGILLRSLKNN
jgi:hypothetical protein